jgi:hypothetical protein
MAYVEIDIEDYLDDVDSKYLITELRKRKNNNTLKEDANDIFRAYEDSEKWPEIKTVLDQQKQDWVIENWNNITLEKLESL